MSLVSGQTNAAGKGIIRQRFKNVPQYMLVKVQLMIRFQRRRSNIHLQPARCSVLQIAFKKLLDKRKEGLLPSHLNKLGGFLPQGTNATTHFADKITGANAMATRLSLGWETS